MTRLPLAGRVPVQLRRAARRNRPDVFGQRVQRGEISPDHQDQRHDLIERQRRGGEGVALLLGGKLPNAAQQRASRTADHHQLHRCVSAHMRRKHQRRQRKQKVNAPDDAQDAPDAPALAQLAQRTHANVLPPQGGAVEGTEGQSHPAAHGTPPHPQQHEDTAPARRQRHLQTQIRHEDGHRPEHRRQQVSHAQVHQDGVGRRQTVGGAFFSALEHLRTQNTESRKHNVAFQPTIRKLRIFCCIHMLLVFIGNAHFFL